MSQPQQQLASNNRKKKYAARKIKEVSPQQHEIVGGAGDAGSGQLKKGKKPLHTSMEQLQVHVANMQATNVTKANANRRAAGANWNAQRNAGLITEPATDDTAKQLNNINTENKVPNELEASAQNHDNINETSTPPPVSKSARQRQKRKAAQRNKYVAMDCEMVGVGYNGQDDMLARVSIVNKQGDVLLDKFVKPRETVTDYRTCVSGVRPHDIEHAEDFNVVQDQVVELLQGKILVGHAIRKDLAVLHIKHPYSHIRDTSRYKPLCRLVANGRTPSLKRLSQAILGLEIQTGEHSSVEDARATMNIYNRLSSEWEKYIQKHQHNHQHHHKATHHDK